MTPVLAEARLIACFRPCGLCQITTERRQEKFAHTLAIQAYVF